MAKRKNNKQRIRNYWYNIYQTALKFYDIPVKNLKKPTEKSIENIKKEWKKIKKEKEAPSVREVYKWEVNWEKEMANYYDMQRDEDYRTETASSDTMYDASLEEIQLYIDKINSIYEDTMEKIYQAENDVEGIEKAFAIGSSYKSYITGTKDELLEFLYEIQSLATEYPDEVALFINSSPELDYVDAITLIPPSDIQSNFEVTMQSMKAIWKTIKGDMADKGYTNFGTIRTDYGEY